MTRIDFYVLPDASEGQRVATVCRLAEKAVRQSKRVFIHTECEHLAATLDSALWQYRDDSFLPHVTLGAGDHRHGDSVGGSDNGSDNVDAEHTSVEPVAIGCDRPQPDPQRSILINLGVEVPPFFSRFERTLEVINQQQEIRDSGRARYSYYQQRGYPLSHHKL